MQTPKKSEGEDVNLIASSDFFDPAWYASRYKVDISDTKKLAAHFLIRGGPKGYSASPRFVSAAYFALNPDVAQKRINPLLHYLRWGKAEGRAPIGRADLGRLGLSNMGREEQQFVAIVTGSTLFDIKFYEKKYPQVRESGLHPVLHYVRYGLANSLDPGPGFDTQEYLRRFPELAAQGVPPLVHDERRRAQNDTAVSRDASARTNPAARSATGSASSLAKNGSRKAKNHVAGAAGPDAEARRASADQVAATPTKPGGAASRDGTRQAGHAAPLAVSGAAGEKTDDARRTAKASSTTSSAAAAADRAARAVNDQRSDARKASSARPPEDAGVDGSSRSPEINEADAVALLADTQFFDAAWYGKRYPDVARSGLDPALHYVRVGAVERRRPSLYFDPDFYVKQEPPLAATAANSLVHFLTIGAKQGRRASPLLALAQPDPRIRRLGDDHIVAAPKAAASREIAWARHTDLPTTSGLMFGGTPLGTVPPRLDLAPLAAFCRLMQIDPATSVEAWEHGTARPSEVPMVGASYEGLGQRLSKGRGRLADGWFVSDAVLRLRLGDEQASVATDADSSVIRAFQGSIDMPSSLNLCVEALLPPEGPCFLDLKLTSALLPVLLFLATPEGEIREVSLLPFPSLMRGGLHHAELIANAVSASPLDDLGRYGDELVRAFADRGRDAINSILIDQRGAVGAEPIFSRAVVEWATRIFGASIDLDAALSADDDPVTGHLRSSLNQSASPAPNDNSGRTLRLPPDAVPTIAALVGRGLPRSTGTGPVGGPFLVAEMISRTPRLAVALPPMDDALLSLQAKGAPLEVPVLESPPAKAYAHDSAEKAAPVGVHLAISFRWFAAKHPAQVRFPIAPDYPGPIFSASEIEESVSALIYCESPNDFVQAIDSLAIQHGAAKLRLRIRVAPIALDALSEVERISAEGPFSHVDIAPATGDFGSEIAAAAREESAPLLLIMSDRTIAHDPRALSCLMAIMRAKNVGTASCSTIREFSVSKQGTKYVQSGGYFPSHVSFATYPQLVVSAPNCLNAFQMITYPVLANQFDFMIAQRELVARLLPKPSSFPAERSDTALGVQVLRAGFRNLCTAAVRVSSSAAGPGRETLEPFASSDIRPGQWGALLSQVAVLRELR